VPVSALDAIRVYWEAIRHRVNTDSDSTHRKVGLARRDWFDQRQSPRSTKRRMNLPIRIAQGAGYSRSFRMSASPWRCGPPSAGGTVRRCCGV
jgi:hypothetical protein